MDSTLPIEDLKDEKFSEEGEEGNLDTSSNLDRISNLPEEIIYRRCRGPQRAWWERGFPAARGEGFQEEEEEKWAK